MKFDSEFAPPVKSKSLDQILNPQLDAQVVTHRLLDFMDRVDLATQYPRPPFKTADGEDIFPDSDEPWWLTDVSRRAPAEEQDPGDEDGPPSEMEEEGQQAEVSDEDPMSSEAEAAPYTPSLGWRV